MNNKKVWAIIGAVIIIVIVVVLVTNQGWTPSTTASLDTTTSTSTTASTTASSTTDVTISGSTQTKPPLVIHFITPPKNDVWKFAGPNIISWDKPGDFSGELVLINATTNKTVGVIVEQVGVQQTSYMWNTRDLFQNRTSPTKITVAPGTYKIVLSYDGNHITPVTSPAFTIVQ